MTQNTKENPGCYHRMLRYLCQIDNLEYHINEKYTSLNDLYTQRKLKTGKIKNELRYKSYDIRVVTTNGSYHSFHDNGKRFDQFITEPINHFICTRIIRLDELTTKPIKIGKYKDSLGGGWYSFVDLYQVNDQFFALMECTC